MIFQHTIDKLLSGEKTQTRRLASWRDGHHGKATRMDLTILSAKNWEVGKTYAVQPGRGKKAVGRIRITRIEYQDVRDISYPDVQSEGFSSRVEFWQTWCGMHDKSALPFAPFESYEAVREYLMTRPADRYQAWVLAFTLV